MNHHCANDNTDKIEIKRQDNSIGNIVSDLSKILTNEPSSEIIKQLIDQWNEMATDIHKAPSIINYYEGVIDKLTSSIDDINIGVNGLKEMLRIDFKTFNPFISKPPNIEKAIQTLQSHAYMGEATINALKLAKSDFFKSYNILRNTTVKIFSQGERLGLRSPGKRTGRENKNPLFEFFKIISGINDSKFINRHYGYYKLCKADPSCFLSELKMPDSQCYEP